MFWRSHCRSVPRTRVGNNVNTATTSGTLTEVAYVDTGDYNQKDSAFESDIRITPNGKFLDRAVRSTSMLHGYMIDQEKRPLTGKGKWSTEKTPRGFNIDPRGNFLLAIGLDSASLTCDRSAER